jgi:Spy/CpxP family protein refolding chaperone
MNPTKALPTALALALGLALALPACLFAQAAEAPAGAKQEKKTPHEKIWWNQADKVEVLALTPEQRTQMDALLTAFFEAAPSPIGRQALMATFTAALAEGDWAAAAAAAEAMADAAAKPIAVNAGLMIDVLKLLTSEQREAFYGRFPQIARRPWVRLQGMARGPGAAARQGD